MQQEKKRAQFSELSTENKRIVSKRCFDATLLCNFSILTVTIHFGMTSLTKACIAPALCHALF